MTSDPRGVEVQVEVIGPRGTPDFTRSLRARAQAIKAAGAMPSTVAMVEDLSMGDISRLTAEIDKPVPREKRGRLREATLHTIVVNR